jgi:hypothetical protein
MGRVAWGHQLAIALAEPALGRPTDGLERLGAFLPTPLAVPTDLGRVPVGPGPFDQGTRRMGMPSFGQAALLTPSTPGSVRGGEPQLIHERSRGLEARQIAQFGPRGHGDGERDPRSAWMAS